MSKINAVQIIRKEDLAKADKDLPAWVDALLDPLNQFMETCVSALRNGLTLADNFSGSLVTLSFTHDVPQNVDIAGLRKVVGVIPVSGGGEQIESFGFEFPASTVRQITVTIKYVGGSSATKSDCSLFIFTQ